MNIDKVSYIRFSSVYRNFEDENSFVNEIDKMKNEKNVVFSCGSGITAAVLGLAYSTINDKY